MKLLPALAALLAAVSLTSCSDHPRPIVKGKAASGTVWHFSLASGQTNNGFGIPVGADVEVYDQVVVIRTEDGITRIAPLSHVSELTLK